MTNIQFLKDRIIFDGHADTRQECETITLMCDNLAKSKDFKTVRYESGYAEFEKLGETEELKFAATLFGLTVNFDGNITKVTVVTDVSSEEVTTSGTALNLMSRTYSLQLTCILASGYSIDTATFASGDNWYVSSIDGNVITCALNDVGGYDGTITITSKQASTTKQTIDLSTLSGWANLSDGEHLITVKVKASGYGDSESSNAVTVTKAQPTAQYYGTLSDGLSVGRSELAATTVGNYALFGGGSYEGYIDTVDAYDTSLTRTIPTKLSKVRSNLAATTVGNYALFGGGTSNKDTVDAYNTSLTRTLPTALSQARTCLAATTVGNYALFGGGSYAGTPVDTVDAYNTSLTRTLPTALSQARTCLTATTVGNYALFGGGNSNKDTVDAYDTSLTRTLPTALSQGRMYLTAITVGDYALFGGGNYAGTPVDTVDAYNTSLTRTIPTALSQARYSLAATTVGNYALFGGGYAGTPVDTVDAYDTSLTRTIPTALSQARYSLAATTVGNYALFGGGSYEGYIDTVDAYTVA